MSVRVTAVDYSANAEPKPSDRFSGLVTDLPPLLFERIEPGESATRNVQVIFPKSGSHVVQAELPPDAIGADNQASCVLDIAEGIRVLLVDGDAGGKHSYFFESALDPGGNAKTGLLIQRERPEYLRDSDSIALDNYACIILQSIPNLDLRALANLHRYVSGGGGLALWFGDDVAMNDYLRGYANWAKPIPGAQNTLPLLPFGLTGPVELTKDPSDATPDLLAEPHPIFAPLLGLSNSPFQFVRIERYVGIDPKLETGAEKLWKPVASLRNRGSTDGRLSFGFRPRARRPDLAGPQVEQLAPRPHVRCCCPEDGRLPGKLQTSRNLTPLRNCSAMGLFIAGDAPRD